MPEPVSDSKFWSPLPLWQVLLAFAGMQVLAVLAVVVVREGLSLAVPVVIGNAMGGVLGVVLVSALARRLRKKT